ncbi:MAG: MerR family transcriptional regulator [Bacteroidia bacterium]
MSSYSIKDIEAVSGIKSHTLRIWEQRYKILSPKRTETNIRFYNDDDLKLILNISILNRYGYRISEISKMSFIQINELIQKISLNKNEFSLQVKSLVQAMMLFDESNFQKILNTNIDQSGLEATMVKIVFPFLNEVGVLWQTGAVQVFHEHFASNIIKQKILAQLDKLKVSSSKHQKRFLLFLPTHEQHSIGLTFADYLLRKNGHRTLYLGREIELTDIKQLLKTQNFDYVFSILSVSVTEYEKKKFMDNLVDTCGNCKILLTGKQLIDFGIHLPETIRLIRSVEEFTSVIENL